MEEALAELAQTNALRLAGSQQHILLRWSETCIHPGLDSPQDADTHTGYCSCCLLSESPAQKGAFTFSLCFSTYPPSGTQPILFFSPSCWHQLWAPLGHLLILQFLDLSFTQEDHDTFWQDTRRCWNKVGLCLLFSVFEIKELAHSFIADDLSHHSVTYMCWAQ